MAKLDIDIDNLTYCGKEASEIMAKEVYHLDLVGYGITLKDNVKGKQKVVTGALADGVWQEYSCTFTPDGEATLDEAYIETSPIKVNMEICIDDIWDTFMVEYTRITLDGGLAPQFSDWFFAELLKKMNKEYQEIAWQGDTELVGGTKPWLTLADGFEKRLAANAGSPFATTAFTSANILAQVDAAALASIDLAASEDISTDPFKIFMNKSDVRLLAVALGQQDVIPNLNSAVFSNYSRQGDKIYVYGFEVVPTEQSRSTIIVGNPKNLVLGFDTYDSHLEYRVLNMREHTGDNTIRVIAVSNIGTQIVWGDTFVYGFPTYEEPEDEPGEDVEP